MQFLSLKTGWKTYAACAVSAGLGIASAFGVHVPDWATWCLAAFFGIGIRSAIQKQSATAAASVAQAVETIIATVTVPPAQSAAPVQDGSGRGVQLDAAERGSLAAASKGD